MRSTAGYDRICDKEGSYKENGNYEETVGNGERQLKFCGVCNEEVLEDFILLGHTECVGNSVIHFFFL